MVKKTVSYDTDVAAKNLWLSLLRDFRDFEGNLFAQKAEEAFVENIATFREYPFPELGNISPFRFKCWKQLSSFLKKYRFAQDAYSDLELDNRSREKFFADQQRISTYVQPTTLCFKVLQRARVVAKSILGQYDPDQTILNARFGKKSSIGCPLSHAYIDEKLSNVAAFTSSSECAEWFRSMSAGDPILSEIVSPLYKSSLLNHTHDSLNLVSVPKNWKINRLITPLTLIGLFYSYGVGDQVVLGLRRAGLDLRRLQTRHRRLVRRMSVSRTHATADLSAASDSLTSELLNRVLPREWYNAIRKTFSHQLSCDGKTYYTASVLPMGNGLTFPVETLVFYSILRAISELSGVKGIISVYGDDLIYPSRMHRYVSHIFPRIGLVLNMDKTFVGAPFRESCGSDYYKGCDVRPAFLPEGGQSLSRNSYISFLYKAYNSLRARWDESEIPRTLRWLLAELAYVSGRIYRVPPSYPATSGIQVAAPNIVPFGASFLPFTPVRCIFSAGSRWFLFNALAEVSGRRIVHTVMPYYWLSLQGLVDEPDGKNFWDTDYGFLKACGSSLSWEKTTKPHWKRISAKQKVRIEAVYTPTVSDRSIVRMQTIKTRSGLISDWS